MQSHRYRVRRHAGKWSCEAFPLLLGDEVNCCALLKPIVNLLVGIVITANKTRKEQDVSVCDFFFFFFFYNSRHRLFFGRAGQPHTHKKKKSSVQSPLIEHPFKGKSNSQGGNCSVCTGSCHRNCPRLRWRCWEPAPDRLRGINTRISRVFKSVG